MIFNFATDFFYKNDIKDINNFELTTKDFSSFKNYLQSNKFSFETETERTLEKVMISAKKEGLDDNIEKDFNTLVSNLNEAKAKAIDENKNQLLSLLSDEIVKRYVYREGLYEYYKLYNSEIKKATEILSDLSKYNSYLR